jgi:periplasmic protein TonB
MNTTAPLQRPIVIASAVALLHVGGLAALQSGLLARAYEVIVPVEMISQIIEPPKPILPAPAPLPPPTPATPVAPVPPPPSAPQPAKRTPVASLPPLPQAIAEPTPSPHAPVVSPAPTAPLPPITAPVAAAPSPAPAVPATAPAPALAPKVELPRSDADYLNNPRPPYPPVSKRLGEQGRVMVRVYVGEDGLPQKSELRTSSGFDRLDATAVATVMRWRFRPGTRGGAPEAMWVNVPIDFTLDN